MDLHTLKIGFVIAAAVMAALVAVFALYVKFGEMSLKKRSEKIRTT